MPQGRQVEDFQPNPFDVQITSLMIFNRADLLKHDPGTYSRLLQYSKDYVEFGRRMEKLGGLPTPFNPYSEEKVTPAEVFYESDEFVGHTQSVPKPTIGMEIRHFRLSPRATANSSRLGPTPELARSAAVVSLIQHPCLGWEVWHAETRADFRRQGIATTLYGRISEYLDTKLRPSGWLSDDAYRFWQKRNSETVQWYRQVDYLTGLWLSPKQIITMLRIAEDKGGT